MGIVHARHGRLAPAILLTALVVLAVAAVMALTAGPANAQQTYTVCAGCHTSAKHSSNSTHAGLYSSSACTTCHANGFSAENKGVTPKACAACHGGGAAILASTQHVANACGTTNGCHGYTAPPVIATTTLTAKVAPTSVKVKKSVKVTGTAGPAASLAAAKVAWKVERKVGTKWTKMKAGTAIASTTGTFTVTYKAVKKGAHRVTLSIAKTSTYTAKKLVKAFKVK
jgi:hypothetical protein